MMKIFGIIALWSILLFLEGFGQGMVNSFPQGSWEWILGSVLEAPFNCLGLFAIFKLSYPEPNRASE